MRVKLIGVVTLSLLLSGCASYAERMADCQAGGVSTDTCAVILQQQDAQQAQQWANFSNQLNQQQAAQAQQDAVAQQQMNQALQQANQQQQAWQQQQSLNNIANAIRGY
ncbi:hypothetical protein RBD90_004480 [Salmonella enterica]|nr:hypothetical protein [Salmonella enterica]ELG7717153.1 hypothetical protein [Salmonella enterica]ELH0823306.1 hypothetical protein [Salmonella enterica]